MYVHNWSNKNHANTYNLRNSNDEIEEINELYTPIHIYLYK